MAELELARKAEWGGDSSEEADENLLVSSPDPIWFPMAETGDFGAKAAGEGKDTVESPFFLHLAVTSVCLSSSSPVEGHRCELLDRALPSGRLGLRTQEGGCVRKGERISYLHIG